MILNYWKSFARDILIVIIGVCLGIVGTMVSSRLMSPRISVEFSWKSYIFGMESSQEVKKKNVHQRSYYWDVSDNKEPFLVFQNIYDHPIEMINKYVRIVSVAESVDNFPQHICYTFKAVIKNSGGSTANDIEIGVSVPQDSHPYVTVGSNVRWEITEKVKRGLKIIQIETLAPNQAAILTVYFNVYGFPLEISEELENAFSVDQKNEMIRRTVYAISHLFREILFVSCKEAMGTLNRNIGSLQDIIQHEHLVSGDVEFPVHKKFAKPHFFL